MLRRLVVAFLWDEAAAQRWTVGGLLTLGAVLTNGGAVPGTTLVLPGLAVLYPLGPWVMLLAIMLNSGTGIALGPKPPEGPTP